MKISYNWALAAGSALLFFAGCKEEAALRVDDVAFTSVQLLGLSERQVQELTLLAAVGTAVAKGEAEELGEGVLQGEIDDLLLRRLQEEEVLVEAGVDEEALERWYLEYPETELDVRHLVVLSDRWDAPDERTAAADRARAALERIESGEPFPDVAGEVSEEPGAKERGGLLEPGREGSWVREFWNAANALTPGQVSEVVETQYGFHVLKLDERRSVDFSEARPRAVSRLVAEMSLLPPVDPAGTPIPLEETDRQLRLAEVSRRGVQLTPGEESEITERWVARVVLWGETFGFEEGMTASELSEQSLIALGLSEQEAMIARMELMEWAEPMKSAYTVVRVTP